MMDSVQTFFIVLLWHNKEMIGVWWPWPNYQTCIDTLLGGEKELIIFFATLTTFSRSQEQFEMTNFDQSSVSARYLSSPMVDSSQTL